MTKQEIEKLYPEFYEWIRRVKHYATAHGVYLIKLWYEFLEVKADEAKKV